MWDIKKHSREKANTQRKQNLKSGLRKFTSGVAWSEMGSTRVEWREMGTLVEGVAMD